MGREEQLRQLDIVTWQSSTQTLRSLCLLTGDLVLLVGDGPLDVPSLALNLVVVLLVKLALVLLESELERRNRHDTSAAIFFH
jgi:hypothetical protein